MVEVRQPGPRASAMMVAVPAWLDAALRILGDLDERERAILEHRVLEPLPQNLTLEELGQQFGVSRERIRQIEKRLKSAISGRVARKGNADFSTMASRRPSRSWSSCGSTLARRHPPSAIEQPPGGSSTMRHERQRRNRRRRRTGSPAPGPARGSFGLDGGTARRALPKRARGVHRVLDGEVRGGPAGTGPRPTRLVALDEGGLRHGRAIATGTRRIPGRILRLRTSSHR